MNTRDVAKIGAASQVSQAPRARAARVEEIPASRGLSAVRRRPEGYVGPAASDNAAVFVGTEVTECASQEIAEATLAAFRRLGVCR
jgi:hypothetical protein